MSDAFALWVGLRAIQWILREEHDGQTVVPEPEFKPFRLPKRSGADAGLVRTVPASQAGGGRSRRTLQELGVPRPLASEIEETLRALGRIEGDRIVGFTYRTPNGVSHALRASTPLGGNARKAA